MIYQGKAVHIDWLEAGIAEFRFDLEGESVNKFNKLTLDDFAAAITALEAESDLQAVVVTSGKDGFIVGADITEFGSMFSLGEEGLREYLREANDAFNRFEDLKVPTVAAINGVALGGGFEMCLACDFRVMSEKAVVGLPEVKLGINPGFGGTVRLPRVIGVDNAVEWIAGGNNKKPKNAIKDGAVDAVVAADDLLAASVQLAKDAIAGKFDHNARREEKVSPVQLNDIERMMAFTTGKALVAQQAGPNMPAPITAVKMMEKGAALGREEALDVEAKGIMRLGQGPEAAALIGLFLNEQDLSARSKKIEKTADPVKRAGVLGAGIMGGGIAYQAAYKGTPMLMKDIAEAGLDLGMKEAGKLLAKRVDRGRMSGADMATALNRIRPTLDYTAFDQLDIVVEAVVENVKVKHAVLSECEKQIRDDAILTSNTSTISITKLAEALDRPENFCGMHFFNPVHRMPLVEVIRGEKTGEEAIARTVKFARQMGKTPVVVNDCPGFLVNRVLFPYFGGFNMLVADGVDFRHVDKVMERFGWPMGPGYLLDVVGMDTAYHAGAVMMEGFPDRMQFDDSNITSKMFLAERLGQKNGLGFYRYEEDRKGRPKKMEDETALKMCAEVATQSIEISDEDIIARMMIPMCIESVRCLDENIVSSPADVDMGLVMGIGFPVFRGGALRYIDQMGAKAFCELADRFSDLGGLYQPTESLRRMAEQGERFFK